MSASAVTSTRSIKGNAVLEALKDIAGVVRELDLGVGGFFALCFMAIFVWGAKRTSAFATGLSGEWKTLIDEGVRVRDSLRKELEDSRDTVAAKDELISDLRRDYADLSRKYYILEAKLRALDERTP